MRAYKKAWEQRDESRFASLFAADGEYRNTPFAVQRGHAQLAEYWRRVKLQEDVHVTYEVLAATASGRNRPLARDLPGGVGGAVPDLGEVDGNEPRRAQAGRTIAEDGSRRHAQGGLRRRVVQTLRDLVAQHAAGGMSAHLDERSQDGPRVHWACPSSRQDLRRASACSPSGRQKGEI